jgi:hypothetical protein
MKEKIPLPRATTLLRRYFSPVIKTRTDKIRKAMKSSALQSSSLARGISPRLVEEAVPVEVPKPM